MDIVRGSDVIVEITIKDQDDAVIDLTSVNGITVEVFQDRYFIDKFNNQGLTGYTALTVTDAVNGVIEIPIQAIKTENARINRDVYFTVKLEETNASFPSGVQQSDSGNIRLGMMNDSQQNNIDTFA